MTNEANNKNSHCLYFTKKLILLFCVTIFFSIFAQPCSWDRSGMVMLKTCLPGEMVYKLEPVLVDKRVV